MDTEISSLCFNTVNGKYCCNGQLSMNFNYTDKTGFNTVNGKYCCNMSTKKFANVTSYVLFQYRKR